MRTIDQRQNEIRYLRVFRVRQVDACWADVSVNDTCVVDCLHRASYVSHDLGAPGIVIRPQTHSAPQLLSVVGERALNVLIDDELIAIGCSRV